MVLPRPTHLTKNGIIRTPNTTELRCTLCDSDTSHDTSDQHIASPAHQLQLRWFRLVFETIGDDVRCTICHGFVPWCKMKLHGRSHLPWWGTDDEHLDRHEIFFRNQIIQWRSWFHCYPCDTSFPSWELTLVHIFSFEHSAHRQTTPQLDNCDFELSMTSWEFLVREGLVAQDATTLRCAICDDKVIASRLADRHVKGLMHLSHKLKFRLKFVADEAKFEEPEREESTSFKEVVEVEEPDYQGHSDSFDYIVKENASVCYCAICDCRFSQYERIEHVNQKSHAIALRRQGCHAIKPINGFEYRCDYCDCTISSRENVCQHVTGKKHLKSMLWAERPTTSGDTHATENYGFKDREQVGATTTTAKNRERLEATSFANNREQLVTTSTPRNREQLVTTSTSKNREQLEATTIAINHRDDDLPEQDHSELDYIFKINDAVSRCVICDCKFADRDRMIHTAQKSHAIALRRHGCDGIKPRYDFKYHCEYCDCTICSRENVYQHVIGKKHEKSVNRASERPTTNGDSVGADDSSQSEADHSNLNYIFRINPTVSRCAICNCEFATDESISHTKLKSHAFALRQFGCDAVRKRNRSEYHCGYCNCTINSPESVYQHVIGKKHANGMKLANQRQAKKTTRTTTIEIFTDAEVIGKDEIPGDARDTRNYLVRLNATEVQCKICDRNMPGTYENIVTHLTGKLHKKNSKKYGCDRISYDAMDHDAYYCGCCDVTIDNIENLYDHVREAAHINALAAEVARDSEVARKFDTEAEEDNYEFPGKSHRSADEDISRFSTGQKFFGPYEDETRDDRESNDERRFDKNRENERRDSVIETMIHGRNFASRIDERCQYASGEYDGSSCDNVRNHTKEDERLLRQKLENVRRKIKDLKFTELGPDFTCKLGSITKEMSRLVKQMRYDVETTETSDSGETA